VDIGNIIMTDVFGLQEVGKEGDSDVLLLKHMFRFNRTGYPHLFKISYVKTVQLLK